jgi:peroxiredoxin
MGSNTNRQQQKTRAQRRATERADAKAHPLKRQKGGISSTLIGGILTVLIVAGIIGYVIYNNSKPATGAINVAADLNPVPGQIAVGKTAPNFTLKDAKGKSYSLKAQRGHPVVLEFFAVWCPVCQGEAPTIAQLTQKYVSKGVRVWAIVASPYGPNYEKSGNTDTTPVKKADLGWFASSFNVKHPQLIDPHFNVVNEYGIQAYPGLYVIDSNGKIVFSKAGHYDFATLSKYVDQALKVKAKA